MVPKDRRVLSALWCHQTEEEKNDLFLYYLSSQKLNQNPVLFIRESNVRYVDYSPWLTWRRTIDTSTRNSRSQTYNKKKHPQRALSIPTATAKRRTKQSKYNIVERSITYQSGTCHFHSVSALKIREKTADKRERELGNSSWIHLQSLKVATMGNTPCVSPVAGGVNHPDGVYYVEQQQHQRQQEGTSKDASSSSSVQQHPQQTAISQNHAAYQFSTTDLQGSFYELHLADRPEKCILDAKQVGTSLVHQAEELVKRELAAQEQQQNDHTIINNTNIPSDEDDDANSIKETQEDEEELDSEYSNYHSTTYRRRRKPPHMRIPEEMEDDEYNSSSYSYDTQRHHYPQQHPYDETNRPLSPSSTAASGLWSAVTGASTSLSAATPVVANIVASPQQQRRRRRQQQSSSHGNRPLAPPRLLGSSQGDLDTALHEDLVKVIDAITHEEEQHHVQQQHMMNPKALGCPVMLPMSASLRFSGTSSASSSVSRQAKMHMITLHLRLRAQCARYVPAHLLQILPTHPFVDETTPLQSPVDPKSPQSTLHRLSQRRSANDEWDDDLIIGEGPPSHAIRLLVDDETPFLDLGITGSLGLVDRPRKRGLPEHYTVLLNRRSGAPLAVCALKQSPFASEGAVDPIVRVYATKRRAYGQRPAASTRKLGLDWCGDSFPLYPWAEIVSQGRYPQRVQYAMYMATGNGGRFDESPSYLAEHSPRNATEIRILGKTERESQYTGCATLCLSRQEEDMDVMGQDDLFFRLSVVKGVDPAIFLCFAAFVDESMEKTMRIQVSAERNYGIKSISV